ncbi:hypothetical protein N0V83_004685 [Neocucurbitaria cava]|uniref:Uncharacterized protein n=1 Tax=Neocucurbitaria cava TaxID=798079 RepID=A0A9W8YC00_9PLEO|nr:hypothetical protein N0V83_004685 [Neocucurbitaria cava]
MPNLPIKPSGVYNGAFIWDGHSLRECIKNATRSYDQDDPRTWPLFKDVHHFDSELEHRTKVPAPHSVAYDQSLMRSLLQKRSMKETRYNVTSGLCSGDAALNLRFRFYPFNFDQEGQLRDHPCIPPDDFECWMKFVHGSGWKVDRSSSTPQATTSEQQIPPTSTNITPSAAYEQIMKSLDASESARTVAVHGLEQELGNMKKQCQSLQYKAKETDQEIHELHNQIRSWKLKHAASDTEAQRLAAELSKGERRRADTEEKLKAYEARLKESQIELAVAKKEAEEANERIKTVWNKMQNGQQTTTQKRKTAAGVSGSQQKKPNTGS